MCIYQWLKSYLHGGGACWCSDEGVDGESERGMNLYKDLILRRMILKPTCSIMILRCEFLVEQVYFLGVMQRPPRPFISIALAHPNVYLLIPNFDF